MLKRKKLLVSCSSPGLFGLPEKLQSTGTYTVKAGLLNGHTAVYQRAEPLFKQAGTLIVGRATFVVSETTLDSDQAPGAASSETG